MSFQPQTFQHATKIPTTFSELLKLFKEKQADASLDLSGAKDPMTRPGLEIRKNGAAQALPGLKQELERQVQQHAGAIFLIGSTTGMQEFIGQASDLTEGNIVTVDANEMYVELAKLTERGLRQDRRWSMDTLNAFTDGVIRILDAIDVEGIPAPNLVSNINKVFPDTASVVEVVKGAVQGLTDSNTGGPIGDGLNVYYITKRATEEAIKEEVVTDFLPVIVLNADPASFFAQRLFGGRNVAFEAKDEVSEGQVVNIFKKLKTQQKPRSVRAETKG